MKQLTLLLCLVLAGSCSQSAKTTRGDHTDLPAGEWSVSGIRIDDIYADTARDLGTPSRTFTSMGAQGYAYDNPDITLVVDAMGRIQDVGGASLQRDGVEVLRIDQPGTAVEAALGLGYRIERFSDKTQGVFTVGSVPAGTVHYYRDDKARYEIFVYRDGYINSIQAQSLERAERTVPGVLTNAVEPTVVEQLTEWFLDL